MRMACSGIPKAFHIKFQKVLDFWSRTVEVPNVGTAEYEYYRNGEGYIYFFRIRKGKFEQVVKNAKTGRWIKFGDTGVTFGTRERYYDPHF